jgi:hypothetical protein
MINNVTQFKIPGTPLQSASTKFRPFGDFDACYWGWDIDGEPYTHKDNTKWDWWRPDAGRKNQSLGKNLTPFGPKDFKRRVLMDWVTTGWL